MGKGKNGGDKVSAEVKKIMDRYSRLADQPGGAAAPGPLKFKVEEAPATDARDQADIDREFRQLVDRFIKLANEQIESVPRENVSMAMLYAAARFNSFVVASHASSVVKFRDDRNKAFEFFCLEYHRMLSENLDDYEKVLQG